MKPVPVTGNQSHIDLDHKHEHKKLKTDPFVQITGKNVEKAVGVLKERLPRSANCYNMALMSPTFSGISIYSFEGELSKTCVLVLINLREDYGQDICLSVPSDFKVTESIKTAFIETSVIDWSSKFMFSAADRLISPMLLEISTIYKKNGTLNNPQYYYIMSPEDAAKLEIKPISGVTVKSLDSEKGGSFLTNSWKYSLAGTFEYTKGVIEKGNSSGVYLKDESEPACGIIENPNGFIGMLFTGREHRNKGYAKICVQHLLKDLGQKGHTAASSVECKNLASIQFHDKLGMTVSHMCDDLMYENSGFEAK